MEINTSKMLEERFTQKEIEGQPQLWQKVYALILNKENEIKGFVNRALGKSNIQVILTGAGSSAFIGEGLQGSIQQELGVPTSAVATTDIVTHPEVYFDGKRPILIISFARSGNSPESLATVQLADKLCGDKVFHIFITCNSEGQLMEYANKNKERCFGILLPEEAHDKSLAMTGSFTSMLLTALLITRKGDLKTLQQDVDHIVAQGNYILSNAKTIQNAINPNYDRVVFLGSGPLLGIARECHLKLQELTDGQLICKHDSFLGFRHGPRAVVNNNTLMVYLFCADPYIYQYEWDLAKSIDQDEREIRSLSLGLKKSDQLKNGVNLTVENLQDTGDVFRSIPATLIGQLLGMYKSLQLNLNPDNPSVSGAISRVVQGVHIYDYKPIEK